METRILDSEKFEKYEKALVSWNKLSDEQGEKLFWVSNANGDVDEAKWAYIRHHTEAGESSVQRFEVSPAEPIGNTPYCQRVWDGQANLWVVWLWTTLIPNIVFSLFASLGLTYVIAHYTNFGLVLLSQQALLSAIFFIYARSVYQRYKARPLTWVKVGLFAYVGLSVLVLVGTLLKPFFGLGGLHGL